MTPNAFIQHEGEPTDAEVAAVLGAKLSKVWTRLVEELTTEFELTREWHSYSIKAGWALRMAKKKRNIVYLGPCEKMFRVSFALGDKAVKAARECGLPPEVVENINQSRRYAEGTAVRIEVQGVKDIEVVKKLVGVKLEN